MMLGICLGLLLVLQTGMENIFSIQVPLDHFNSGSREITIDYSISGIFDSSKPTVFYLEDPVDSAFGYLGIPTELKSQFNIVSIQGRYQSNELIDFLENRNESDWELNYILLNQRQVSEDLELIRRKLLGNEKVTLLGHYPEKCVNEFWGWLEF